VRLGTSGDVGGKSGGEEGFALGFGLAGGEGVGQVLQMGVETLGCGVCEGVVSEKVAEGGDGAWGAGRGSHGCYNQ
jgi:hypothetical protein